jgi:hypothetical protein
VSEAADAAGPPVFVLGITPRSGTNHLWDLLALHPDFGVPAPVWEDALVQEAHHLWRYIDMLDAFFRDLHPEFGVHEFLRQDLPPAIGRGLRSWLESRTPPGTRLLTKTPSVRNLDRFFELFPDAYLISIVRDGRAVAESCVRTFGWTYEQAIRHWVTGADTILAFEASGTPARYQRVHYEELIAGDDDYLRALVASVGADPDRLDLEKVHALPVRGSSTFTGETGAINWGQVQRTGEFRPTERASHWDQSLLSRYEWLAGEAARRLGYSSAAAGDARQAMRNRALDLRFDAISRGRELRARAPSLRPWRHRQR